MKCRLNTESKNPRAVRAKDSRIMLLSKYAVFDSKKLKSIKKQEASGLVSSLDIITPLIKILTVGSLLF